MATIPTHDLDALRKRAAFSDDGRVEVEAELVTAMVLEILDRRHRDALFRSTIESRLRKLAPSVRELREVLNELDRLVRRT